MRVKESRWFLDSSIWLGYFLGNLPETRGIIDSEENILFTSIISIHEVFKKLRRLGRTEQEAGRALKIMEDNGIIINLNKEIAIDAVKNCEEHGLHTIDSLIYSSAIATAAIFVTADKDFMGIPKIRVIAIE